MTVKKIVRRVLAVLGVLLGGFLVVVAMQPEDFSVTRSATMAAPPARVFSEVNSKEWRAGNC